ncbi:hypothetical protein GW766_00055 [Candidatus Parcubacteria bacterium]|nr:hypothetical protein [Candidatus Parcubacteria bacterium]
MHLQQDSNYHRFLRTAALLCALVLAFESGLVRESTKDISKQTHLYLANVIGMSAAVQPNELNQITAELTKKERELAAREAALREREITVELSTGMGDSSTATYILSSVLFILLILILLNYTLDYLRLRELRNA